MYTDANAAVWSTKTNGKCNPVDGGWSNFGDWSSCSVPCGDGTQTRTRSCNNPTPADGGADCVGEDSESQPCNMGECAGKCNQDSCTKGLISYVALEMGDKLMSLNGIYSFIMQTDGNLVLYCNKIPLWDSNTHGLTVANGLWFQADSNLVLYNPAGGALWNSGTNGSGATKMIMQNDGNFVMYTDANAAVWSTKTNGKC